VITDDAVVLGLLAATLGVVFGTARSERPALKAFYRVVPPLLVCYFVPALYNSFGLVDGERSQLYFVASRYLLPATLVLLTLPTDMPAVIRLGPKALVLFLAGTVSVILGGPLAILIVGLFSPETVCDLGDQGGQRVADRVGESREAEADADDQHEVRERRDPCVGAFELLHVLAQRRDGGRVRTGRSGWVRSGWRFTPW